MAVSKGNTPVNSFVKGLITEVSPLSFPENASLDEVNFKLKRDGTRERRLGLDYEDNYSYIATGVPTLQLAEAVQSAFRWPNPSGASAVDIGVIQIGKWVWFINLLTENPSAHVLNGGVPVDGTVLTEWQFAVINNELLAATHGFNQPVLVSYNDETDVISWVSAPVVIRDFYGVDDSLGVAERATTISDKHRYNLMNQGWTPNIVTVSGVNAIDATYQAFGVYPANSDQWAIGRIGDLTNADVDKYDPQIASRNIVSGGQAPKGHYIIDLFARGLIRRNITGLTLPNDRTATSISTVTAYAGRAWYSGINGKVEGSDNRSPNLNNAVLYSQVLQSPINLVQCYQENDPTNPYMSDVIDTDGGIVFIPEAQKIVKLFPVKNSLFVFATNGVWEIRGDEGGFRATSFQVNKISSVGVYSKKSIIEANGTIFFWAIDGIFVITPNPNYTGVWDTTNVTLTTIQKIYNSLPDLVKKNARGIYDLASNTCRWLYYSGTDKRVGDPVDIVPPATPITYIGEAVAVVASYIEPKVVSLSATQVLIVYRNTAATSMRGKVVTIDNLGITVGAEQTLVTSTSLGGHSLTFLSTGKVLLTYAQNTNCTSRVLTISGTTVTAGTAYVVNTVHASSAYTSPIRSKLLDSGNVLITFINTDTNKVSLQVLSIDSSNVVTYGTVAKGSDVNLRRPSFSMLTDTTGVILGDTTGSTRCTLTTFSISGTTPTISATSSTFLTTTQIPSGTYSNTHSYIAPVSSSRVLVVTSATTSSPSVSSAMFSFNVDVSETSLTSTTVLRQDLETGTVPTVVVNNSRATVIYRKINGAAYVGRVLYNHVGGATPTEINAVDLGSDVTFAFPEFDYYSGNSLLIAYETATGVGAIAGTIS